MMIRTRNARRPRLPYARTSSALTFLPESASASRATAVLPDIRTHRDVPRVDEVRSDPEIGGIAGVAGFLRGLLARRGGLESAG